MNAPATPVIGPKSKFPSLYVQVLFAIGCGVLLGWLKPEWGQALKPLGEGFVTLIKMLISPIVFCTVVVGIAGMGDLKKVGRVGAKALLYFEVMTTVALLLGLLMVHVVKPGAGMHVKLESISQADLAALDKTLNTPHPHGVVEHLQAMIPESMLGAFVSDKVLQVLVLALLFGIAIAGLGERGRPLLKGLEVISHGLFAVVGVVMRLAPLGAFGAMAFAIGKYGLQVLSNLALLMGTFYATALLFVVVVLGLVVRSLGLNIFKLIAYLKDELLIVLGTSSSESVLPQLMGKLERLGCAPQVVRLVVPTGYSFNLDGTCIYLTLAALFVGQALDVPTTLVDEVGLLMVLLITSKGAAAVTGGGFITLAATLSSVGSIPVGGLSLLLGIDRFMSEARALTNMMGNSVATLVVARWENEFDVAHARAVLAGTTLPAPAPVPLAPP